MIQEDGIDLGKWPGKYVIGLTGNIATGKSIVREMLERLGAYGIDADAIAHRCLEAGSPCYPQVLLAFGDTINRDDGSISREELARRVFADPEALSRLESIIHPQVLKDIDALVKWTDKEVVVIEAIKLLESGVADGCDAVWVLASPFELQLERLVKNRQMVVQDAVQRIKSQPAQENKIAAADVLIQNHGSLEEIYYQVEDAWEKIPRGSSD
jgi:dephospho-CoA kinase